MWIWIGAAAIVGLAVVALARSRGVEVPTDRLTRLGVAVALAGAVLVATLGPAMIAVTAVGAVLAAIGRRRAVREAQR